MEALRVSLDLYDVETLRQIATALELREADVKLPKPKLLQRLLKEIPSRAANRDLIKSLSETDRAILALVLEQGGQMPAANLLPPLMLAGLFPELKSNANAAVMQKLEALLDPLFRRGLLLNLTLANSYGTRRQFRPVYEIGIAPEVAQVLPRQLLSLPQPSLQRLSVPEPPQVRTGDPEMLLRQLFFTWSGLLRTPARRLKSGQIAKADLRRLARDLNLDLETQEMTLRRLVALLLSLNLVQFSEEAFIGVDNENAQRFWQLDFGVQLRQMLMAFVDLEGYPDIDTAVMYVSGYGYSQNLVNSLKVLNHQILMILQQLLDGSWFSADFVMTLLNRGRSGAFIFPDNMLRAIEQQLRWASGTPSNNQAVQKQNQDLQRAETAVFTELLEQWCWLGLIDLGYMRNQPGPWAIRLTDLGRAVLRQQSSTLEASGGQLILQPDFQVLALGPVPFVTLLGIERIAERETVQPAAVGYRLTRNSIYRALQNGASIGVICAFLNQITGQPLPQNVERTLEEWGAQHERIVVRRDVLVLQTDTPAQLEALLADSRLSQWLERLDACTALASSRNAKKIQARLRQLEILPAVSKGPEADLPHSLIWDEGRLLPRTLPTSLYVTAAVRSFAAPTAAGWEVTPASVREATHLGLTAPEILAQIERLTGAPLSAEWQKRLKAWSSHYGSANVLPVHLLRLESAEALAELRRSDRQLSRWLRPLEGDSGLAIIDDRRLEEALAQLAALGVNVEEGRWW